MREEKRKNGFTLVELLIVIVIIGILATLAVPQYQKMVDKAKFSEAWTNLNMLWKADELYYVEYGNFAPGPSNAQIMDQLVGYIIESPNNNPNRRFEYVVSPTPWNGGIRHWQADGDRRIDYGGPNGRCLILRFSDGHVEKWMNYPLSGDWKRID